MRIGELAEKTGVSRDALRFYERRGLIQSIRLDNGYRDYPDSMIFILNFIKIAQGLGFTLADIGQEVPDLIENGISQERIAEILKNKIAVTEARIEELQVIRDELNNFLNQSCPLLPPE